MKNLDSNFEQTKVSENPQLVASSALTKEDWESQRPLSEKSSSQSEKSVTHLVFDDSIYASHGNTSLDQDANNLRSDLIALSTSTKGSAKYDAALDGLNTDEKTLNKDVMGLVHSSKDFQSLTSVMDKYHAEFKDVAQKLWSMGLRDEASETTAYYPLSHYEKYFANKGGGTGGTGGTGGGGDGSGSGGDGSGGNGVIPPDSGAQKITGLDSAGNEAPNMKASQIGGSGSVESYSASQNGADSINFSLTGKAWTDGLWRTDVKTAATEKNKDYTVQLDDKFSLTASQLANTNEIEKDIEGPWGMAGTQINTKTGEVDYWDSKNSDWVDVGKLGPLKANTEYDLQLGVHSSGDPNKGNYTFDYYSLNGEKLQASKSTFDDKDLHWAPGLYIQTQLDLPGKPTGAAGMTESDQELYVS
ncbi:MAG TPA: hypothetical protein V6C76_06655 [Drouetiella sp.]